MEEACAGNKALFQKQQLLVITDEIDAEARRMEGNFWVFKNPQRYEYINEYMSLSGIYRKMIKFKL